VNLGALTTARASELSNDIVVMMIMNYWNSKTFKTLSHEIPKASRAYLVNGYFLSKTFHGGVANLKFLNSDKLEN